MTPKNETRVSCAQILELRVRDLNEKFQKHPPVKLLHDHGAIKILKEHYRPESQEYWINNLIQKLIDEIVDELLQSFFRGRFPLWVSTNGTEQKVPRGETISHDFDWEHAFRSSEYRVFRGARSDMVGLTLWVKDDDWMKICASVFGEDPKPSKKSQQTKSRRGRPSGSGGYKLLDAPIVEKMKADLEAEPSLSPYAAGMRYAEKASGGGTLETKAKRLVSRLSD